jgi:AcrR family transcriptional regulator
MTLVGSDIPESFPDRALRERLMGAALERIAAFGMSRLTSESIEEATGCRHGSIALHFGSLDAMLLAVFEKGMDDLRFHLQSASIEGATIEERLRSFVDIVGAFHNDEQYLALLEVELEVIRNPVTSDRATAVLTETHREITPLFTKLIATVFEGAVQPAREFVSLLYYAARGMALSQAVNEALPTPARALQQKALRRAANWEEQRALLVQGLSAVYRDLAVGGTGRPPL